MTYIVSPQGFNKFGETGKEIIQRSGDAMKTEAAPRPTQIDEVTRIDHFRKTGEASQNGPSKPRPIVKTAAGQGAMIGGAYGTSQTMYTSPSFYSPIHTPTNWQIPTKRREVYMWARFFGNNNPTIKGALRFYSEFPFRGYEHVINDPIRKEHFDNLKKRLKLEKILPLIAKEYFMMGDAFPFISISCKQCGGFGILKDGSPCNHEEGQISAVTCLNPDWVDVQINPLMPTEPVINLIPDDSLKQIVWSKKPEEIYAKIPDGLKKAIMAQKPIKLSNRAVAHLKHDESPYMPYGQSIISSLFPTLAYQDRLKQAQWIVAERHILPIKVCKIGSDLRPASSGDISDTQRQLAITANDPNLTLVTHHNFEYEWIGAAGKVLQLTKEYELIDSAIIQGLGVNDALLSGTGPSYSQAAIGIEATIKRLETVQRLLGEWICDKLYKMEAQMRGFYKKDLSGNEIIDYPEIRWDDLNLRDETQRNQMFIQLWDKQIVSTQFICEKLGIDYDTETERVRLEQMYQQQMGIAPQAGGSKGGGGMGGGFGGGLGGLGGGGLGGAGGAKGGKPGGGNLPGGKAGPGLPGDSIAPSMSGGAPGAGGAPSGGGAMAAYETQLKTYNQAKQYAPSVTRKSRLKEPKMPTMPKEEDENGLYVGPRTGAIRLTSIEQKLYTKIAEAQKAGNIGLDFVWQQKPEPEVSELSRVVVDGFFPELKLIVEADGKKWHSSPEDVAKDQERDANLQRYGWNVLRFTEDEINYSIDAVIAKIINVVNEAQRTASNEDMIREASVDEIEEQNLFPEEKEHIDDAFLRTANRSKIAEKIENLSEQISEDLSEIDEESEEEMKKIIKQDNLQDLIS